MANKDTSKVKLLFMYDYFLRNVKPDDEENPLSISTLIDELRNNGIAAERKSIYADIRRLNDFVIGVLRRPFIGNPDAWVYLVEGKKGCYSRHRFKDELSEDELQLIIDAIRATPFTASDLVDKLKSNYPYEDLSESVYSVDKPQDKALANILHMIREGINCHEPISFKYGYRDVRESNAIAEERHVSPATLKWDGNHYYLIAVDNPAFYENMSKKEEDEDIADIKLRSIRTFRLDRILSKNACYDSLYEYVSLFPKDNKKRDLLKEHLEGSIQAFANDVKVMARIRIEANDKTSDRDKLGVIKAYNNFVERINLKKEGRKALMGSYKDGFVEFNFESADVPTLYTALFELVAFGQKVSIIPCHMSGSMSSCEKYHDHEYIKNKFSSYVNEKYDSSNLKL